MALLFVEGHGLCTLKLATPSAWLLKQASTLQANMSVLGVGTVVLLQTYALVATIASKGQSPPAGYATGDREKMVLVIAFALLAHLDPSDSWLSHQAEVCTVCPCLCLAMHVHHTE